jgi:hypothetical protein
MKKFIYTILFSIFLIGCATTNKVEYSADDIAREELREEFENFSGLPQMIEKGFDLDKLCEFDDALKMRDYLQPFFIDENGMPLDQHVSIKIGNYEVKTRSQMVIDFSNEYGSKDELLNKGYKEDEIFYYPYFNGEWKDGYRVGKKRMNNWPIHRSGYEKNYSVNSEKALLIGLSDFRIRNDVDDNEEYYDEISKSDKDYLILDLSYNKGGRYISWYSLVESINKMKPKEIFVLCSDRAFSLGDDAPSWIEAATNIKTTIIGYPTSGAWKNIKTSKVLKFKYFTINCSINDNSINWKYKWDNYNLPYPTEGIGVTPDIYTNGNAINSLEVVKHLISGDELSLPEDYVRRISWDNQE